MRNKKCFHLSCVLDSFRLGKRKKKTFLGRCLPNLFTHPRVFVRFGRTKGDIWVEKGDFRG